MFGLQTFGQETDENLKELLKPHLGKVKERYTIAKFDLSVMIDDSEESICGVFNYATSLFEIKSITSYINTYKIILEQIVEILEEKNENKLLNEIHSINTSYNIVQIDTPTINELSEEETNITKSKWSNFEVNN